jgi:hypothetical protein
MSIGFGRGLSIAGDSGNGRITPSCVVYSDNSSSATSFLVAVDSGGTGEMTVPASIAWNIPIKVDSDGAILYAKGTRSTNLNVVKIPKSDV